MKAKYKHEGNDCLIYDQIICEDNVVVTIQTSKGWFGTDTNAETKVCLTNAEARRIFFNLCKKFENQHYDCVYKEDCI